MNALKLLPRRIFAFVARDFRLFVSYRMQFFMRIVSVLAVVTTLFSISKIFSGFTDPQYSQWRDPLASWLTGLAVLNYFMTGFSSLANSIRQEQMQGTLESVLLTPINLPTVIVASSAWDFLETTFFSFLYLFFGRVFFGVHYRGSFFLAVVFLLLTTVVLACLGILSASFAMVFKRGDPFGIFLGAGSALFSGVFFPTQLLREYAGPKLGNISLLLPATYGLDGIRQVLIEGHGLGEVTQPLFTLLCFLVVLLPFSLWVFDRAVHRFANVVEPTPGIVFRKHPVEIDTDAGTLAGQAFIHREHRLSGFFRFIRFRQFSRADGKHRLDRLAALEPVVLAKPVEIPDPRIIRALRVTAGYAQGVGQAIVADLAFGSLQCQHDGLAVLVAQCLRNIWCLLELLRVERDVKLMAVLRLGQRALE